MGIDPLTHKPLQPPTTDQPPQEPPKVQGPPPTPPPVATTTEPTSTITESAKDDSDKIMELVNNDFCIDEIPVIEPHEMLISCDENSSTPSSSTSSSSSSNLVDELQFPVAAGFDDYYSGIMINDIWYDDFSGLDKLINDIDSDLNSGNVTAVENPVPQYPMMITDEESWKF
ncbi:hypothetical protein CDL12_16151 [Handroanthus impetiginosus]|uniref:Uncharacterized protein n=1 Tax=Handroanthus impetiginosus TaxID=429701 RepID=A0A2G9H175_9LAMI|nr:hypothetical protein CDL12_16151 [Handroanthus impetiginosus]